MLSCFANVNDRPLVIDPSDSNLAAINVKTKHSAIQQGFEEADGRVAGCSAYTSQPPVGLVVPQVKPRVVREAQR